MAALSEIEKLEARWAENPDGRYFAPLADAYRKAGRVDDAIMVVGQGLTKHPDYLSAHIVLGRCYLEKKDDTSALATFEKVLGLDTENIIALKSLAEIAERQQRKDDARRWLQRLLTVDAMNAEAAADLTRLGGPLEAAPEPGAAPEPESAGPDISFADVALEPAAPSAAPPPAASEALPPAAAAPAGSPQMDPALMKLANQQTLHIPHPAPQMVPTVPMPAIDLDARLESPPAPPGPAPLLDIEPTAFEAPVAAGGALAGLEQPETFEPPAPQRMSTEVAPAIDFMAEPPQAPRVTLSGSAPVEINLDAPPEEPAVVSPPPAASEPLPPAPAASELPLIMPEDVTPAEELRRPSAKQVQMVSPEPQAVEASEPMVTETMGDLYLKQGFKDKAADVYRRLLASRPGDAALKAKLAALEAPPPALSASAQGAEAVGSWLKRIARASLSRAPSPMEEAFAASEPEPAPAPAPAEAPSGAAARPATDAYTLDRIFGGKHPGAGAPPTGSEPAGPSSFDEFFGEARQESAPPQAGAAGAPAEEDLSAFTTWLHGLKR